MLQSTTLHFLKALKKNNNKEWFDANRENYNKAKADFENLVTQVLQQIAHFDKSVAHLQAKECMFRINRDVRFSNNKAPYKTNMAMYISAKGKKAIDAAGYYFHLEPGKSFLAGGIWMPMSQELKKIRQEIDYNHEVFKKILGTKKFQTVFGSLDSSEGMALKRAPKGYEEDNPAIEYLKLKSFVATSPIPDELLTDKKLVVEIGKKMETVFPLVHFLHEALQTVSE
jgi:uncharacterized protein (TIGR02453 family)